MGQIRGLFRRRDLARIQGRSSRREVDRFFETGRRDVARSWRRSIGSTAIFRRRGRLISAAASGAVLPLSERFDHVVGVDISDDMIAEAARNCTKAGVRNVDFVMSDDALTAVAGSFDLVHSYIVLQHIPVKRGLALTDRMLARLSPGGVAALHYSLQRTLSPAKAFAYAMKHVSPFGRVAANLVQRKTWDAPAMQMNNYPVAEIIRVFEKNGLADIVVIPERHGRCSPPASSVAKALAHKGFETPAGRACCRHSKPNGWGAS